MHHKTQHSLHFRIKQIDNIIYNLIKIASKLSVLQYTKRTTVCDVVISAKFPQYIDIQLVVREGETCGVVCEFMFCWTEKHRRRNEDPARLSR